MPPHTSRDLSLLTTEQRNPATMNMDRMSTSELLKAINEEDKKTAFAVEKVLPDIEAAVELVYQAFLKGGRLFYVGAGTSGRLAVLDASECPPTFRVPSDRVQAVMAGGQQTFVEAEEGSEDNEQQGALDLKERKLTKEDIVIGITASGRTPYPIGALKYAKQIGCAAISLTCNQPSVISRYADCNIEAVVGPEVLTGSTRMKAGTAHKMILNMLSTAVMVKMGKVYENLMVDVQARNYKLRERAKQIVIDITGVSYQKAEEILEETGQEVKPAIVMIASDVSFDEAKAALDEYAGKVRDAIDFTKGKHEKS